MDTYDPTIENYYRKQIEVRGKVIIAEILDTAGQEEYTSSTIIDNYLKNMEGFVVVYSITSRKSFERVSDFFNRISDLRGSSKFPAVLVGTKCDMENLREVSTEEGLQLSKFLGCPHYETSAKQSKLVKEAFVNVMEQVTNTYVNSSEILKDSTKKDKKKKKEKCTMM